MFASWGEGAEIGRIYKYREMDSSRIGGSNWRPKVNDLCLCIEHCGDFFYEYLVMREQAEGGYKRTRRFGAYIFGTKGKVLSKRNFHLICAGEPVTF